MYTIRLLDQDKILLGRLPVIAWQYSRKISESTDFSITIAREEITAELLDEDMFAFLSPMQPILIEDDTHTNTPISSANLSYFLQLYEESTLIAMGKISKRDFTETTVVLKAHTEEYLLSLYRTPAQYGIKWDNTDICDVARDMLKGWRVIRVKSNWSDAVDSSQVDIATEPTVVLLDKDGAGVYFADGYITFEFDQPDTFENWERIRWSADNEAPVFTTMAYRTYDGSWSGWSAEFEGALPDQLGIEIVDTDAEKVQVRITLSTDDQESEDPSGDPVGSTPALFAVEIIARTPAYLTGSIPASSSVEVDGISAKGKTALQVLKDACDQVGWEFQVFNGVLYVASALGVEREVLFRAGTNMDISSLGDDAAEITNVLIANGIGDGINRPQLTLENAASIDLYGIKEEIVDFETESNATLATLAADYLADKALPFFAWKVKVLYDYGTEPEYETGDQVTVVDPNSGTVLRSRIMEEHRGYSGDTLSVECYLGKTRADLVARHVPVYRLPGLPKPKAVALYAIEKGIGATIPRPESANLWAYTELYISDSPGVDIIAENLVAKKRATRFEVTGLLSETRYYFKARYIDIYGRYTAATSEFSLITLKFSPAGSGVNIIPAKYAYWNGVDYVLVDFSGTASVNDDDSFAYFGDNSLKLISTGANSRVYMSDSTTNYNIPITPNKKWIISAYVYGSLANMNGQLFMKPSSGDFPSASFTTSAAPGTWTRVSGVIDLSADDSNMFILRVDNDHGSGNMYYDGIMVEEQIGSSPTPSAFNCPNTEYAIAPGEAADDTATFIESGVAFQTANGKFKVLVDGTIEAVDGNFSGVLSAASGNFGGIITRTHGLIGGYTYPITIPSGSTGAQFHAIIIASYDGGTTSTRTACYGAYDGNVVTLITLAVSPEGGFGWWDDLGNLTLVGLAENLVDDFIIYAYYDDVEVFAAIHSYSPDTNIFEGGMDIDGTIRPQSPSNYFFQVITANSTYTPGRGIYVMVGILCHVEIYDPILLGWRLATSSVGGTVFCDGANVRIRNTDLIFSQTLYYRIF